MLSKNKYVLIFSKRCHVLNMLLTFWPLKSYVLIRFILIKNVYLHTKFHELLYQELLEGGEIRFYSIFFHSVCLELNLKESVLIYLGITKSNNNNKSYLYRVSTIIG